jgi:hypothetical protein
LDVDVVHFGLKIVEIPESVEVDDGDRDVGVMPVRRPLS